MQYLLNVENLVEHFSNGNSSFYLMEEELPIEIDNVGIARSRIVERLNIAGLTESFINDLRNGKATDVLILAPNPINMMIENRGRCLGISLMKNEFVYVTPGIIANGMIIHGEGGITLKMPGFAKFVREKLSNRDDVKNP